MNASNPQLVQALDECRATVTDHTKIWNENLTYLSNQMLADRYDNRGSQYNRNTFTAAAMLCLDAELRELFKKAGGNMKAFDEATMLAQEVMKLNTCKPNPAVKIANILDRLEGER